MNVIKKQYIFLSTIFIFCCAMSELRSEYVGRLFTAAQQGDSALIASYIQNNRCLTGVDKDGNTILHIAARCGHTDIVELLSQPLQTNIFMRFWYWLTKKPLPSIDAQNKNGDTPLHEAVKKNQLFVVDILLKNKAKTDIRNKEGLTPFLCAIKVENIPTLALFARRGIKMSDHMVEGKNILTFAIEQNKMTVVARLLRVKRLITEYDKHGKAAVHYCVELQNMQALECLLLEYKDVRELPDKDGRTPFMYAVANDCMESAEYLLSSGISVDAKDKNGATALHYAVWNNNSIWIARLLDCGAAIDTQTSLQETPLHCAVEQGNRECVFLLLSRGASLVKKNRKGETPFFVAVTKGHEDIVTLLAPYSDINASNNRGVTPCMQAIENKHYALVNYLLSCGVDVEVADIHGETALHKAVMIGSEQVIRALINYNSNVLHCSANNGDTALHYAVRNNNYACTRLLLEYGARMYINKEYHTPLLSAIAHKASLQIIKLLLSSGAVPTECDSFGNNCLTLAIMHNHAQARDYFLMYPYLINQRNNEGYAPLHIAIHKSDRDSVKKIISLGYADINISCKGCTPLMLAVMKDDASLVEDLLVRKADITLPDKDGLTPLVYAAYHDKSEAIKALHRYGVSPFGCTQHGDTALHVAAFNGSINVIKFYAQCYDFAALLSTRNAQHMTPLFVAVSQGHKKAVKLLLKESDYLDGVIDVALKYANTYSMRSFLKGCIARRDAACQEVYELQNALQRLVKENIMSARLLNQKAEKEYAHYRYTYNMIEYEQYYMSLSAIKRLMQKERNALQSLLTRCYAAELKEYVEIKKRYTALLDAQHQKYTEQKQKEQDALQLQAQLFEQCEKEHAQQQQHVVHNVVQDQHNQQNQKHKKCAICYERKDDVRAIPCKTCHVNKHGICHDCLKGHVERRGNVCPMCNLPTLDMKNVHK